MDRYDKNEGMVRFRKGYDISEGGKGGIRSRFRLYGKAELCVQGEGDAEISA